MDEFAANRRDASQSSRPPMRPPPPPAMSRNPHQPSPMPHMFGNLNAPAPSAFPQINIPPHMQRPQGSQVNPNMPMMQPPYPPPQYPGSVPSAPPVPSASHPPYGGGRPRDWEEANERSMYEPDSKRMRPFPPNPNNPAYPSQQQPPYNRALAPPMPLRNPNLGPPGMYNSQQHSRMLSRNPPIHPPNPQAMQFQQRQGPFPSQAGAIPPPMGGPPLHQSHSQREGLQFPPKISPQFPGQHPPHATGPPPGAYDRLPPPPRKHLVAPSVPTAPSVQSIQGPIGGRDNNGNRGDLGDSSKEGKPLSFKDFLLQQPDNISSAAAQEAYDTYVATFSKGKPKKFFDAQKDKEWFKERYDPDYVSHRVVRIREEVQDRAKDYHKVWDLGGSAVCAPDLAVESRGTRYPRRDQHSSNGVGSVGSSAANPGEKLEVDVNEEVTRDGEASGGVKTGESTDATIEAKEGQENLLHHEKKEDSEVIHAEPNTDEKESSKREGVESEETNAASLSGMKSSDVNRKDEASSAELIAKEDSETAVFNSNVQGSDESTKDGESAVSRKESVHVDESMAELALPLRREHQKDTIFMRGIPLNTSRDALTEVLKHGPDGTKIFKLRRLKLGDINPLRSLQRFGWAVYESAETAAAALEAVRGAKVKPKKKKNSMDPRSDPSRASEMDDEVDPESVYEIDCMLNLERKKKFTQGRVLPFIFGVPARMRHDVEQAVKMMRSLNSARFVEPELNPLTDEFLATLEDDGQRLDHIVTYLREVHYFCYYSGNEFLEDPTSMPPQEVRPNERSRGMSEADNRLVKRVDERAKWVLERDYDRPRSNSDNSDLAKKEAVQKWLEANTKKEGPNRFRCGQPPHKLFKGPEFVHKHLRVKHGDKIRAIKEKAYIDVYRANFENDASRDEVISIYEEGLIGAQSDTKPPPGPPASTDRNQQQQFPVPPGNVAMGMYNSPNQFVGGIQPMPMMMMPRGNFGPGYPGSQPYPNAMNFAGRGMNVRPVPPRMPAPSMRPIGLASSEGMRLDPRQQSTMHREFGGPRDPRGSGHRDLGRGGGHRDVISRDSGPRDIGFRGKRGGYPRRGGGAQFRGGSSERPLDPRARQSRRGYNDLDAPSNGPAFDLVRYDDV